MILQPDSFLHAALPMLDELYGAALRYTHSPADAGHLVQATMEKASVDFSDDAPGAGLRMWLLHVMTETWRASFPAAQRLPDEVLVDVAVARGRLRTSAASCRYDREQMFSAVRSSAWLTSLTNGHGGHSRGSFA